ncbi:MAG: OmpA family protein [Flavobacteriales bacterium]
MKNSLLIFFIAGLGFSQAQDLPTNPDPGKCYVKCITKNTYKDITETIEIEPAHTELKITPATYKTVEERVVVKEASKKYIYVPATYESIDVSYAKKAANNNLEITPATFGDNSKTFEIRPKTSGWEYRVLEDCPSMSKDECIAACFVEYPAENETINLKTLVSDAKTKSVPAPAQNSKYKKQVIKTPARMEEVEIPAEYTVIKKRVIDTPAKSVKTTIPAKTQTITRTVIDKVGGISTWEAVECSLLDPNILPIFYELNSARLTTASKKIIDDTLMPILKESNVSIEIMSHTDSRGNDDFNMKLSQRRANSVINYLVSKNIAKSRLTGRGFGETRLTNDCSNGVDCSETKHRKNRRTEFRVLGN